MESKIITAIAMVVAGASMKYVPEVATPILMTLVGASLMGIIAELHKRNKKR